MAPSRKRKHLSTDENANTDAIVAALPLNDLHQPDPTAEDPDREAPSQKPSVSASKSLFVRGLGPNATSESLTEFFSQSFLLKHATVVLDPNTKKSKGYGFVTLADPEDAQRAKEDLNGARFGDKKIKVDIAEPRQRVVEEDAAQGGAKRSKPTPAALESRAARQENQKVPALPPPKLIIRNLPFSIQDPEELSLLFRSYGKIKFVDLPKTPAGKPAGFGFVTIRGRKNAEKAMAGVNGKEVDGRMLAVDWAVEKDVWEEQQRKERREAKGDHTSDLNVSDSHMSKTEDDEMEDMDQGGIELPVIDSERSDAVETDDDGENELDEDDTQSTSNDVTGTIFIRNLPFSVTDDELYEHFRSFGPLRYARVVMDHDTGYSRGTGFVCFHRPDDAISCCKNAPKDSNIPQNGTARVNAKPSLLENIVADTDGRYTLEGRVLNVTRAVGKSEATRLTSANKELRDKREKDKRRLYLLSEGTLTPESPLYAKLPPSERKLREDSAKQRQDLVKNNPSLHLSLTRLAIRNIPRFVTSKDLKALAREAVVGFATDVKAGHRAPLSPEELARGGEAMKEAEHSRKAKGKGIVSQAKVVFESKEGSKVPEKSAMGRSRGYGFVEYATHRSALMGLRYLNGHLVTQLADSETQSTSSQDQPRRLIVEFAIENAQVVARRRERTGRVHRTAPAAASVGSASTKPGLNKPDPSPGSRSAVQREAKRKRYDAPAEQAHSTNGRSQKVAGIESRQHHQIIGRKRAKRTRRRAKAS